MRARRNRLVFAGVAGAVLLAALAWWLTRPRPSIDMATLAPESTALYVQVDSLPELAEGLTESDAWARLAKPLGLSSQLDYAGPVSEMLGRLEMGPDDAVVFGRSQFAVVVSNLTTGVEAGEESGALVVRPRFALVVKTHSGAGAARRIASDRLPLLARKAYGSEVPISDIPGPGEKMTVAQGPTEVRRMVWAVRDDVVILGNDVETVRAVLDTAAGRSPSLAGSFYLERARALVEAPGAIVFAYAAAKTGGDIVGLSLGGLTSEGGTDSESGTLQVGGLLSGLAKGAAHAVGYAGRFEQGRFVERTATILTPRIAETMTTSVAASAAEPQSLSLVPEGIEEVNVVRIQRPGDTVDTLLTTLSGNVDVSVSATVTQMAIGSRRAFGAEATDTVAQIVGDEVAFVDFGSGEPFAVAFEILDSAKALPIVARYLAEGGNRSSSELYDGFELLRSSHEDGRAFAFIGRFGVYGTRDQLVRMIDARASGGRSGRELGRTLSVPPPPIIGTERRDDRDAAELLFALSIALRTSDGAPETLERADVAAARAEMPRATSRWDLRDGALVVETRSAVGNLSFLTSLLPGH